MKKKITIVLSLLIVALSVFAQKSQTITGRVLDEKGEPLAFANILLGDGNGTISDEAGYFSIQLQPDEIAISMTASYMGYQEFTFTWTEDMINQPIIFELKTGIDLPMVVVSSLSGHYGCILRSVCCGTDCFIYFLKPENKDNEEEEDVAETLITTYPNPFVSQLNIEMEVKTAQPYLFHLYNEAGQLVFAEARDLEAGQQTLQFDLVQRHLPEGIYFLRISDDAGELRTKRLVKVNP